MEAPGEFHVSERLLVLWHFAVTRWFLRNRNREQMLVKQRKKLCRFLRLTTIESPFYRNLGPDLGGLPVMTKPVFLANFAALNRDGVTLVEASAVALRAERDRDFKPVLKGGLSVGFSSGTSGARQVFLVSREDRCRWAGQILARMLSRESLLHALHPFRPPLRIALFLRASSNLYTTVSGNRVHLAYYDLTRSLDLLHADLILQKPDILVAPATVLGELARRENASPSGLRPSQIISVAEVLDDRDRQLIEKVFQIRVGQIYQAAEGFLGSTCVEGRLHLNEESMHIEPKWMDGELDRFQPVITDFSRTGQWFVRGHLDDILRVDPKPCPCGRATLTLLGIEGRAEDVLWAKTTAGASVPVFPDSLRQALYSMEPQPGLYRLEQHGDRWEMRLKGGDAGVEDAIRDALEKLMDGLGLVPPELEFFPWTDQAPEEKQKRIRCVSPPP